MNNKILLEDVYTKTWMGLYIELLNKNVLKYKRIHPPHEYWSMSILKKCNDTKYVKELHHSEKIDFHYGFRDYNFSMFHKIESLLIKSNAELFLVPFRLENQGR